MEPAPRPRAIAERFAPRRRAARVEKRVGPAIAAAMAACGLAFAAVASAVGGFGSDARAARVRVDALDLRDAPQTGPYVNGPLGAAVPQYRPPSRFSSPNGSPVGSPAPVEPRPNAAQAPKDATGPRPRIVLIVDDVGPNAAAFDRLLALPGPLTLSFLSYADGVDAMAARAAGAGHAVMLHLPMAPDGPADPGPNALHPDMDQATLDHALDWHLTRFDGYVAVNNHMGSRLTRDADAMGRALARLDRLGVPFVDSLTTACSVAPSVGARIGARVYARDLFLDAEPGREVVARQLGAREDLARERGLAIAICHPRADTLAMLGPWLTTAPLRGFELTTIDAVAPAPAKPLAAAIGPRAPRQGG
ncbi:MAG: divergent polysaccharide deacetylase family protein [Parvularculaceae bacterium]